MKFRVIKKRRRLALTNYSRRIALLKGSRPRVVVRKSNRGITAQIIDYQENGDKVLATVTSAELKRFNWLPHSNMPTAYLTGMLLAKKAKSLNVQSSVLDIGLYKPVKNSVIFAAARGVIDGGLKIESSIEVDAKRVSGHHIAEYAKKLKAEDSNAYKKQFAEYLEGKVEAEKLPELFEATKKMITAG